MNNLLFYYMTLFAGKLLVLGFSSLNTCLKLIVPPLSLKAATDIDKNQNSLGNSAGLAFFTERLTGETLQLTE